MDRIVCTVILGVLTYFKFNALAERWRLVECHEFSWRSKYIQRQPRKMLSFACLQLWIYDYIHDSDSLDPMKRIQYSERDKPDARELCLEPLPLKLGELKVWAKSETNGDQASWRFERFYASSPLY